MKKIEWLTWLLRTFIHCTLIIRVRSPLQWHRVSPPPCSCSISVPRQWALSSPRPLSSCSLSTPPSHCTQDLSFSSSIQSPWRECSSVKETAFGWRNRSRMSCRGCLWCFWSGNQISEHQTITWLILMHYPCSGAPEFNGWESSHGEEPVPSIKTEKDNCKGAVQND